MTSLPIIMSIVYIREMVIEVGERKSTMSVLLRSMMVVGMCYFILIDSIYHYRLGGDTDLSRMMGLSEALLVYYCIVFAIT
jgi:hypothetical protein